MLIEDGRRQSAVATGLDVGLGLRQAEDLLAGLPLAALLEQLDPFETFQNVSFRGDGAGAFETAMLRHKLLWEIRARKLRRAATFSNGTYQSARHRTAPLRPDWIASIQRVVGPFTARRRA